MWSIQEGFIVKMNASRWKRKQFRERLFSSPFIAFYTAGCRTRVKIWCNYYWANWASFLKTQKTRDDELSVRTCDTSLSLPTKTKLAHFTCCHYQERQHTGLIARVRPKVSTGHRASCEILYKTEKKLIGWRSNSRVICYGWAFSGEAVKYFSEFLSLQASHSRFTAQ